MTSDVPLSAVRGVDTRSIWTSRASRSRPTPTVKTGTAAAFSPSSASVSEASVVSAPSLTSTMPASGSPASSWRAPSSAAPSLVCAPANVSSSGDPSRAADDEKRNVRRTNRSDSALTSAASFEPNACWTNAPRGWVPQSAICMLRESSISTARKFCCGDRGLDDEDGTEQAEQHDRRASRGAAPSARSDRARGRARRRRGT